MLAVNKPIFSTEITIKPRIKTTKHTMNDRMTPKSLISMVISNKISNLCVEEVATYKWYLQEKLINDLICRSKIINVS